MGEVEKPFTVAAWRSVLLFVRVRHVADLHFKCIRSFQ